MPPNDTGCLESTEDERDTVEDNRLLENILRFCANRLSEFLGQLLIVENNYWAKTVNVKLGARDMKKKENNHLFIGL